MKLSFRAVGGAPCWRCAGIVHHYTIDDTVTLVDARCEDCNADNAFCPSCGFEVDTPAAVVVTAHRLSQALPRLPSTRCRDCGWVTPRFDCPHTGCNGVALHTKDWPR